MQKEKQAGNDRGRAPARKGWQTRATEIVACSPSHPHYCQVFQRIWWFKKHTHTKTPQNKKKVPDAFGRLLKGDEKDKFWGFWATFLQGTIRLLENRTMAPEGKFCNKQQCLNHEPYFLFMADSLRLIRKTFFMYIARISKSWHFNSSFVLNREAAPGDTVCVCPWKWGQTWAGNPPSLFSSACFSVGLYHQHCVKGKINKNHLPHCRRPSQDCFLDLKQVSVSRGQGGFCYYLSGKSLTQCNWGPKMALCKKTEALR